MSFLKEVDFLSPPISLFYQGSTTHSSIGSGILSIITAGLLIYVTVVRVIGLFSRDNETLDSKSFSYFVEDAGTININLSTLFHFISIEDWNDKGNEEFDFSYFNALGFEQSFSDMTDFDITNYNHWVYGLCNENDRNNLKDIVTQSFFTKSACIRKFFDSETKQYYDINDSKFKWPSLSHGISHPDNKIYNILITSCNQNIINNIFNGELTCQNIDNFDMSFKSIHLNFVDQYIDVLKYEDPITKYFYRITNKLDSNLYSINHLIFNPSSLKTNKGYIVDVIINDNSFRYERNEIFTYQRTGNIFNGYSLYLNNRIEFYERSYENIEDTLSALGGIYNIIIYIMTFINNLINSTRILLDFNFLLNLFSISIDDIKKSNKENIIDKKIKEVETLKKDIIKSKKTKTRESIVKELDSYNKQNTEEKEIIKIIPINTEKDKKNEVQKDNSINDNNKNEKLDEVEGEKKENKSVFSFCEIFLYKITCGKKNKELELYDDLMKKMISVENLMHNYLNINNLIKENKDDKEMMK